MGREVTCCWVIRGALETILRELVAEVAKTSSFKTPQNA